MLSKKSYLTCPPVPQEKEILHFLGWRGTPLDAEMQDRVAWARERIVHIAEPRAVYDDVPYSDGWAQGTSLQIQGDDARMLLSQCDRAVLMAATLGAACDRALHRMQVQDMRKGLFLDAAASAMIEAVCDMLEAEIRKKSTQEGLYITDRFSPGYGDMPLLQNREICGVLDTARQIGLTVTGTMIMVPQKSVCAVLGISRVPQPHRQDGCAVCQARDRCAYRKQEQTYHTGEQERK